MKLFCDTSFLIALYDANDQYHEKAASFVKKEIPDISLLTSDYVFDETLTFLLHTHPLNGFLRARAFDRDVFVKKSISIFYISEILFEKARGIFFRFNKDKKWSFTDCTTFVLMEDYNIGSALSFDKNFLQRGLRILP